MAELRTAQARASRTPVVQYAPIACALSMLGDVDRTRMRKKFDVCYLMAKEGIAFEKFVPLCELESCHGVELGHAYRTAPSASLFTHYIAQSHRQQFLKSLCENNFYSFLMDGSTDAGNVEQELVVILTCMKDDAAEEMKSCTRFLSLESPKKANASGLVKCLSQSLAPLGITDILDENMLSAEGKPVLVGGGTDGASVNVAEHNGMKGMMLSSHPWLVWSWCYAHHLELASKNALTSDLFISIDEMLLRLFYLYEKSPKKTRELEEVVKDLQEVYEFPKGGNKPVRCQGSRWINHKRKALQRVVDRYGAYIGHLITLSEDHSVKADERARIKGYLKTWTKYSTIVGCALYVDILKSPSLLSMSLQTSELDIVLGIKNTLKSTTALKTLAKKDPFEWPTVKLLLQKIEDEGGKKSYQGAELRNFSDAVQVKLKQDALKDVTRLDEKMRERLMWSDIKLLRAIVVFLETQSWTKQIRVASTVTNSDGEDANLSDDDDNDKSLCDVKESVDYLASHFRLPLDAKGVLIATLQDEIEDAVEYARNYLDIGRSEYRKVWYKLHTCPDQHKWPNLLKLCALVFSLPFSNGRVEQIFSSLKVVKTSRRTNLENDTLNDLLEIYIEGPPLGCFCPDVAIELWWSDCCTTRRVNQQPRKAYRPRNPGSSDADNEEEEECTTIQQWDDWFGEESETDED
ncbi:zinc finger protein 862-like [Dysidea avara]|uniref:zinc finger protein 862-like n=1 Tax=Dysidea avara TaxID=196820 RepID=UPI00332D33C4